MTALIELTAIASAVFFTVQLFAGFAPWKVAHSTVPTSSEPAPAPQPEPQPEPAPEPTRYAAATIAPEAVLTVAIEPRRETRRELLAAAKELKVKGYSRLNTEVLREAVEQARNA